MTDIEPEPSDVPDAQPKERNPLLPIIVGVAALALVTVGSLTAVRVLRDDSAGPSASAPSASSSPALGWPRQLRGVMYLRDSTATRNECLITSRGYDDIGPGTQVTLTDQDGTVIGTANLERGHVEVNRCAYSFAFAEVPERPFYGVEVSRRGIVRYSQADLDRADWYVTVSLGQ